MDISQIVFGPKLELDMPTDEVSTEGVEEITRLLSEHGGLDIRRYIEAGRFYPAVWSWRWTVPSGPYVGNLPKRIQSLCYKTFGVNLSASVVSELGNIARRHTNQHTHWVFDFDNQLNWNAGDFGDQGSCFWTDKPWCLPILREAGGFAIRIYDPQQPDVGIGRGLVLAYDPAKDDLNDGDIKFPVEDGPPALLVFNGYGQFRKDYVNERGKRYGHMQSLDYARILAQLVGKSYGKMQLSVNGSFDSPVYINNDGTSSFIVSSETLVRKLTRVDYRIDPKIVSRIKGECAECGRIIDLGQTWLRGSPARQGKLGLDGQHYCVECFRRRYGECYRCRTTVARSDDNLLNTSDRSLYVCDQHRQNGKQCTLCGRWWYRDEMQYLSGKKACCPDCWRSATRNCTICRRRYDDNTLTHCTDADNEEETRLRPVRVCKTCLTRQQTNYRKRKIPIRYTPINDPLDSLLRSVRRQPPSILMYGDDRERAELVRRLNYFEESLAMNDLPRQSPWRIFTTPSRLQTVWEQYQPHLGNHASTVASNASVMMDDMTLERLSRLVLIPRIRQEITEEEA